MAENFRVLLSDSLASQGIEVFKRYPQISVDVKPGLTPAELAGIIGPYDALVIRSATKVTRQIIDSASSLRVIGRAGVGVDNVDLNVATRRGIVVMNSPLGNSITTAEHTITMMMAMARHIPAANAALRAPPSGRRLAPWRMKASSRAFAPRGHSFAANRCRSSGAKSPPTGRGS